ncbi:rhamnan synthesis F family protein [Phyllobacterium sp. P30BS-XVII]|uniref:rhamnan synthesis F family protein n=1 Tax=Phyllobacterium sp. P30BS-XVII TaxID=2587046 RepID=UPI0015F875F6|nr:rhamnan synthesis F family protein [Phyllobacterium sp. P30BS-XVII]MBA8904065.1 rhamnosyltransferase [Phyllobacterium sp. P30BS-XVII]
MAGTKRLAVAFFYDEDGIVDDYMPALVKGFEPFVEKTIFVSNGPLHRDGEAKIKKCVDEIIIRENDGFDVWAYKTAIESIGYEEISKYDELILYNHTNYGPLYPLSELFTEMDSRECDFWGITDHAEMSRNPFTHSGVLPYHINSHFIAVRRPMLQSSSFKHYWANMPEIANYTDSVVKHESRFTSYFEKLGFKSSVYLSCRDIGGDYPLMLRPDEMMLKRCPILKRRMFFGDTNYLEVNASDTTRALDILKSTSDFDLGLIWKNAARTSKLRTLNVNATLMSILADKASAPARAEQYGNIAVCAHMYYTDMLPEILSYTSNIPVPYDFIATTDTENKKNELIERLTGYPGIKSIIVRVVEENRGRDMSALFISCRDLFLDDRYDYVCRVHTKKTPQVEAARGEFFKRHLLNNLLGSKGYVTNLLNMLVDSPWIGIAIPPIIHISFYTIGHAWYNNKSKVEEVVKTLNIHANLDDTTPVASYGTMFWFRPSALRKIFKQNWKWTDFNKEPNHADGGMAHALERVMAYVAQDSGYITQHVSSARSAAQAYVMLEHKVDLLTSALPTNSIQSQRNMIVSMLNGGGKHTVGSVNLHPGVLRSIAILWQSMLLSFRWRVLRIRPKS